MRRRLPVLAASFAALGGEARAGAPLNYLWTHGPAADPATSLTWGLLGISIAVVIILTVLVPLGAWLRRSGRGVSEIHLTQVERRPGGVRWIWIGVAISIVPLFVSLVWTVATLAAIAHPPGPPALNLRVTGEQWWWRAAYENPDPGQTFSTANEIHIPVGRPVRVTLTGADVIHSFWVPQLAGKTDAIPGRDNIAWLQADKPGRYQGQCTEYCGQQHAHMGFTVIAEPAAQFEAWRRAQLVSAAPPATASEVHGLQLVTNRCGVCHAIRGTDAGGTVGPDLTHLMSRQTIAAGALPNGIAGLSGWIGNPQAIKPGTRMPTLYLSGPELADVRSYLLTLK